MKCRALAFFLLPLALFSEPRTWTSTSGSTIEATFLGAYGEDFWFEAGPQQRFLKMPSKYISSADVELVESGELTGTLPPDICDKHPESVELWEQIYTSDPMPLPEEVATLEEALAALIEPLQPQLEDGQEEARIEIKFKKRKDRKAPLPESVETGTIYQTMQQLLEPHTLRFKIIEANILIVRT